MTIHQAKSLEFPVVAVGSPSKRLSSPQSRSRLIENLARSITGRRSSHSAEQRCSTGRGYTM